MLLVTWEVVTIGQPKCRTADRSVLTEPPKKKKKKKQRFLCCIWIYFVIFLIF